MKKVENKLTNILLRVLSTGYSRYKQLPTKLYTLSTKSLYFYPQDMNMSLLIKFINNYTKGMNKFKMIYLEIFSYILNVKGYSIYI